SPPLHPLAQGVPAVLQHAVDDAHQAKGEGEGLRACEGGRRARGPPDRVAQPVPSGADAVPDEQGVEGWGHYALLQGVGGGLPCYHTTPDPAFLPLPEASPAQAAAPVTMAERSPGLATLRPSD